MSDRELSLTGTLLARSFISSWRTAEPPRPGEERQQTGGSPSSVHLPRCTLHCTPLYCTHSLPPTQHLSQPVWLTVYSVITSDLEMLIKNHTRDLPDYPVFYKSSKSHGKGSLKSSEVWHSEVIAAGMTVCYYKFHFASFHSSKYNKTLVSRGQFIDEVIRNLKLRPVREEDYLPSLLSLSSAMESLTPLPLGREMYGLLPLPMMNT